MKYDHAFTLAFSIISDEEDASDVTGAKLRQGIQEWLDGATDDDLLCNCGEPFDTFEAGT